MSKSKIIVVLVVIIFIGIALFLTSRTLPRNTNIYGFFYNKSRNFSLGRGCKQAFIYNKYFNRASFNTRKPNDCFYWSLEQWWFRKRLYWNNNA